MYLTGSSDLVKSQYTYSAVTCWSEYQTWFNSQGLLHYEMRVNSNRNINRAEIETDILTVNLSILMSGISTIQDGVNGGLDNQYAAYFPGLLYYHIHVHTFISVK